MSKYLIIERLIESLKFLLIWLFCTTAQLSRKIGETLFRAIDNDLGSAGLTLQQTNSEGETNEVSIETFASNFLQSFAN